jgi:hypothetical protein
MFKPWRTGKDLKLTTETWDDSFLKYKFSMCQCEIIKYFNMRYECLDARDDYSARRHLLESKNVIPQWTVDHANGETDDDQFYEGEEFQVDSYESLNVNLRLVLLTRGSM